MGALAETNLHGILGSNSRDGLTLMPDWSDSRKWNEVLHSGIDCLTNREYFKGDEVGAHFFALSYRHDYEHKLFSEEQIGELRSILEDLQQGGRRVFIWLDAMYMKYHHRRPTEEGNDWVRYGLEPYKALTVIELDSRPEFSEDLECRGWISFERTLAHRRYGSVYFSNEKRKVFRARPQYTLDPLVVLITRGLAQGHPLVFSTSEDKDQVLGYLVDTVVDDKPDLTYEWKEIGENLYCRKAKTRTDPCLLAASHWNESLGIQYQLWVHKCIDERSHWKRVRTDAGDIAVSIYKGNVTKVVLITFKKDWSWDKGCVIYSNVIYNPTSLDLSVVLSLRYKNWSIPEEHEGEVGWHTINV